MESGVMAKDDFLPILDVLCVLFGSLTASSIWLNQSCLMVIFYNNIFIIINSRSGCVPHLLRTTLENPFFISRNHSFKKQVVFFGVLEANRRWICEWSSWLRSIHAAPKRWAEKCMPASARFLCLYEICILSAVAICHTEKWIDEILENTWINFGQTTGTINIKISRTEFGKPRLAYAFY